MNCEFIELPQGFQQCRHCGRKYKYTGRLIAVCITPCPYLGPPIERDGVTLKVKCGCNGREHDQPRAAHECGLYKRCLPTLRPADLKAWEERPESKLYRCCHGCDRGISAESGAE